MFVFVLGFVFVFVILKGKIINLWSLFIYVCPDSSLESVKHIFKNNEFGQIYLYIYIYIFNYWAMV